jgi:hypothetical protein
MVRDALFIVPLGWCANVGQTGESDRAVGLLLQKQRRRWHVWYQRVSLLNVVRVRDHADLCAMFQSDVYSFELK